MKWILEGIGGKKKGESTGVLDMSDAHENDGHCMISGNLQIRGDVQFAGTLRVDGKVDGKISVFQGKRGLLVVSKGAVINGPVSATNMIVDGTVNGDIMTQQRLECRPHAIIRGEVQYENISVADGARIEGKWHKKVGESNFVSEESMTIDSFLATRDVGTIRKKGS